jgi:uncharacterized protein YbjT (DUF2867 family)
LITIIGASGHAGTPAIAELVKRGESIRALTSSEKSAASLKSRGVAETVIGDFRKSADLERVIDGADRVLFIPPAMVEDQATIGKEVVAAVKAARTPHFVFLSCLHPQVEELAHHWHKLEIEQDTLEAGINFTILQPAMYMQNLAYRWKHVESEGVVRWPWEPGQSFTFIDTRDLGEVIAINLTSELLHNGIFELCAGGTLTIHDTAQIITEELGRPVSAEKQDAKSYASELANIHSPWRIENMLSTARYYDAHGHPGGNSLVAEAILGRKLHDYRAYVRHFLDARRTNG